MGQGLCPMQPLGARSPGRARKGGRGGGTQAGLRQGGEARQNLREKQTRLRGAGRQSRRWNQRWGQKVGSSACPQLSAPGGLRHVVIVSVWKESGDFEWRTAGLKDLLWGGQPAIGGSQILVGGLAQGPMTGPHFCHIRGRGAVAAGPGSTPENHPCCLGALGSKRKVSSP